MTHFATLASASVAGSELTRDIRIKPECVPDGFGSKYDFHTFWYDAVQHGTDTILVCPKLFNFEDVLTRSNLRIDAKPATIKRIKRFGRHDMVHINGTGHEISVTGPDGSFGSAISPDGSARFAGKNLHLTMSQNNDPLWIEDFARYHIQHHGLQAMILLDNQTTEQSPQDISDALARSGLEDWLIIPCPFPYGERALRPFTWRSKFLQTAVYNGIRYRYCQQARAVLNCDLDELVVCPGGSIFDLAARSPFGFVRFPGTWYSTDGVTGQIPRHSEHSARRSDAPKTEPKYCITPKGMFGRFSWDIHFLENLPLTRLWTSKKASHMHCLNVSNGWKGGRDAPFPHRSPDPEAAALLARTHWS